MELDPEVHAHHHKVGHRWIDLALALSALVLSITSIIIAIENDHAMKNLVTANSWPYLELSSGNLTDSGAPTIHFDVRNDGIGPAMVEKFVLSYNGQVINNPHELLQKCCGYQPGEKISLVDNAISGRVLAARDTITFLVIPKQDENLAIWKKLDDERFKISMQVCYSSVFGERWISSDDSVKARSVQSCDELPGVTYHSRIASPPPTS